MLLRGPLRYGGARRHRAAAVVVVEAVEVETGAVVEAVAVVTGEEVRMAAPAATRADLQFG